MFLVRSSLSVTPSKNSKNVIIGHLNVNSLRNKFTAVEELIKRKIDIGLISETKIDESFLNEQFKINGYKTIRRYKDGGLIPGILK